MKRLGDDIIQFFHSQGYVVVSTIDKDGFHPSCCKGIVKINRAGRVYILDLYRANTYDNLKRNPRITITAIDEHKFIGYCLKGRAKILLEEKMESGRMKAGESRITGRLTHRLLKNIREEKGHPRHPEILLPRPEYMIAMDVEEVVDLTPHHLK